MSGREDAGGGQKATKKRERGIAKREHGEEKATRLTRDERPKKMNLLKSKSVLTLFFSFKINQ